MPWVLRMSRGRYHMDGDQRRDSGPANRLHVQVLEIFCYHRASRVYSSVQGPHSGLSADAKSSLISQISLYPKISCFLPLLQSNLCQFSALPPPQCVDRWNRSSSTLSVVVIFFFFSNVLRGREKKNKQKTQTKNKSWNSFQVSYYGQCIKTAQAKMRDDDYLFLRVPSRTCTHDVSLIWCQRHLILLFLRREPPGSMLAG